MEILILGGTRFVGRHLTQSALDRGHEVTLFNRGNTNPDLFPDVETLIGDRDGKLDVLKGHTWDVVIDTCGYVPRLVRDSAELLKDSVGWYTFISTISVYDDMSVGGNTEDAPLKELEDKAVEEITGETYGGLKVLCEQVVEELYPENNSIIRPGLVVGPYDYTDRFPYWPHRIGTGGDVLVPDTDQPVQYIDGRDLAAFTLLAGEEQIGGTYNCTGPEEPITMRELFNLMQKTLNSDANLVWVDEDFIDDQGVERWAGLPFWLGEDSYGTMQIDCGKAIESGLRFRPTKAIIKDTFDWTSSRPDDHKWATGIDAKKQTNVIAVWREKSG